MVKHLAISGSNEVLLSVSVSVSVCSREDEENSTEELEMKDGCFVIDICLMEMQLNDSVFTISEYDRLRNNIAEDTTKGASFGDAIGLLPP